MRSFSLLALAAAALAPFVAAAPTPASVDVGAGAHTGVLVPRGTKGVAAILVDLKVDVSVQIDALNCLTVQNATTEVITPILQEIVTVVGGAVVELKALVGADISVILSTVDGTAQLAVGVIASLLAEILILIFGALGFVLTIVADVQILVEVLVAVAFGECICELISAVLALVDGLLGLLVPLVLCLLPTIVKLGLDVVANLLKSL